MLYIYFLLYSVHLIIYRGTGNRWAVCDHRWAFLWCWWVIVQTVGGVCSSVGVPPGVGG